MSEDIYIITIMRRTEVYLSGGAGTAIGIAAFVALLVGSSVHCRGCEV